MANLYVSDYASSVSGALLFVADRLEQIEAMLTIPDADLRPVLLAKQESYQEVAKLLAGTTKLNEIREVAQAAA